MKIQLFGNLFWGLILIVIGANFILKHYIHMNIPVFRIIIGLMVIYFGFSILFGNFSKRDKGTTVFSSNAILDINEDEKEYSIIFGNGIIDLTDADILKNKKKIIVNSIFANTIVRIPNNIPLKIQANTAFGEISSPDRKSSFLGEHTFYINADSSDSVIKIIASSVFGSMQIRTINIENVKVETEE